MNFKIFFGPAVTLMNRYKYPQKMALVVFFFLLPLAVVMYLLISEVNSDVKIAQIERTGLVYERALMKLFRDMQQHRGMTVALLSGATSFENIIDKKRLDIDEDIGEIDALDIESNPKFKTTGRWNDLKIKCRELKNRQFKMGYREAFDAHTAVISDILKFMVYVADKSDLTLDPDVDSNYLTDTIINKLPVAIEYLGQVRALSAHSVASKSLTVYERAQIIILSGLIGSEFNQVESNIKKVFEENPGLRHALDASNKETDSAVQGILKILNKKIIYAKEINVQPDKFFSEITMAVDAEFNLYNSMIPVIDGLLTKRIAYLSNKKNIIEGSVLFAFLIVAYLFGGSFYSTTDSLSSLVKASRRIAEGDLTGRALLETKDEMAIIAASFNDMASALERNIAELKTVEQALKRYSSELEQSNRELEQFASIASHDLQEPLRVVSGFAQLIRRRYSDKLDDTAGEFISYIIDGTERMQHLISDLLAYSRVGTRGKPFEPIDCNIALKKALDNLKMSIEENGAVVETDSLPTVMADEVQIIQLFQNLIGNAIKYRGKEPPYIRVSSLQRGYDWLFSVSDNGIGIETKHFERIFQIFQRLHKRDEYPGTGIGLAICKKIVERHGGAIWVESEHGRNATFYFTMPLVIKAEINK